MWRIISLHYTCRSQRLPADEGIAILPAPTPEKRRREGFMYAERALADLSLLNLLTEEMK
jgi:hypothetical protein